MTKPFDTTAFGTLVAAAEQQSERFFYSGDLALAGARATEHRRILISLILAAEGGLRELEDGATATYTFHGLTKTKDGTDVPYGDWEAVLHRGATISLAPGHTFAHLDDEAIRDAISQGINAVPGGVILTQDSDYGRETKDVDGQALAAMGQSLLHGCFAVTDSLTTPPAVGFSGTGNLVAAFAGSAAATPLHLTFTRIG